MSDEKIHNDLELEEKPKIEEEKLGENIDEEKIEEKKNIEEKPKKKIIKRAPMEKTVDDTIKEFDKLLQSEVSFLIKFYFQEPDSDKFENLFEKLKKEKEKKEIFYLFMKTFDKIQEVNIYFFHFLQFREEFNKNNEGTNNNNLNILNNLNNENNNNFLLINKNELVEFKNDFIKMKSLLSHKRNPEDKIEKVLENTENKNGEGNDEEKKNNNNEINDEKNNNNVENNNNEEKNKSSLNKKRLKKIIKKNNKKKEEKSQESQNKEKEEGNNKQKQTNKNISDYFNFSGKKEPNPLQVDTNLEENKIVYNLDENEINKDQNVNKEMNPKEITKEINCFINKDNNFSLNNFNKTRYDNSYINSIQNIPEKIKYFYSLDCTTINEKNKQLYLSSLKNYFNEYNTINNIGKYDETNTENKKLIYIHDSFAPIKKIPTHKSHIINPRNYLKKDEYIIDYDKDSEDEYMEENAEDIKSNDNEDKEEDEDEDVNSQQDDKFIVPDGHLSEEEVSDKDIMEERQLLENSQRKQLDILSILNIRKTYSKPVLVDFRNTKKKMKNIIYY